MINGMNIYQNIDCIPKNNVVFLELDENEDSDLLYLPVVFSRQLHKFSSLASQQLEKSDNENDVKHLYPGSIVLTRTNIFLTLRLLPVDIHSHDCCSCEFRDNDKTVKEVIIFSDIIESVTEFRQYISDEANNTVCYGYMLKLLGGVHSIFFNRDETRTVLPYYFDNKLNEKHDDENAKVKSIVPEWVQRVEKLIGAYIETITWHKNNSSCCDHNDEHNFGMENTTICLELLWENAARQLCNFQSHLKGTDVSTQLCATLSTSTSNPVEWEAQRQGYLNDALAAYISLMHEEHADMEKILLQWFTSIRITTTTTTTRKEEEVPNPPRVTLASTSLSLRNHVGEFDYPYCFDGRSTNIADEVMMLLAEEEMVARMKLEKYTATAQKIKGV